jgi:hypothetical protein
MSLLGILQSTIKPVTKLIFRMDFGPSLFAGMGSSINLHNCREITRVLINTK